MRCAVLARVAGLVLLLLSVVPADADSTVTNLSHVALEAALAEGGYITFDDAGTLTVTNTITITNDVFLDGIDQSVELSGGGSFRIFNIAPDVTVTFNGLTFTNGLSTNGGALYIMPGGIVEITECVFTANSAEGKIGFDGANGSNGQTTGGNGGNGGNARQGMGGAIYNAGDLTISLSQFQTNTAFGGDGGNGGNGGSGSFQGGNGGDGGAAASGLGGAIFNIGTLLEITDCTFENNAATGGNGGAGGTNGTGAYSGRMGSGGPGATGSGAAILSLQDFSIQNCTFFRNTGTGGASATAGTESSGTGENGSRGGDSLGGAVFAAGASELINCTFVSNNVTGGTGGHGGPGSFSGGDGGNGGNGIGGGLYSTGTVTVVNCTFSGCGAFGGTNGLGGGGAFAGSNGSPGRGRGGDLANAVGTLTLINTILATSIAGGNVTNVSGTLTDGGHNISSDLSFNFTDPSRKGVNPRLRPLADNGGATKTMGLQTNSPAINAADDTAAPATDQRGVARPIGDSSDIGAYESNLDPVIITQPVSQTQTNNGPVAFTVFASGEPPLRYFWRFYGTNIPGATNTSYSIAHVALSNAGPYSVLVSNTFGTNLSAEATLTVLAIPQITSQPTDLTAVPGATATFSVGAVGSAPLSYQWRFNSNNISGATASAYSITNVQPSDGGTYSVVITNTLGSATSTGAVLTVNGPPGISMQPSNQSVVVGSSATFSVTANGPGPITYRWRFFGTNIPDANGASFSRSSVQFEHAGPYDVVVSNSFGTTESITAFLIVNMPSISGQILEGTNGLAGVQIAIGNNMFTTSTNGTFQAILPVGTYALTPMKPGYGFEPPTTTVSIPPSTNLTFAAFPAFSISGRVFDGTNGLGGVSVHADAHSSTSAPDGSYTIQDVPVGTYFVFASLAGYKFSAAQEITVGPNASNVNFFVSNRVYSVSGRVLEGTNGLSGVTFQEFASLTTDNTGAFKIDLAPNTYTFTPRKLGANYGFSPTTRTVVLTTQEVANVDFAAGSVISATRLMNGEVQLAVISPVRTNRIDASTNLIDWESIFTNRNSPFLYIDRAATNYSERFYRAVQQ